MFQEDPEASQPPMHTRQQLFPDRETITRQLVTARLCVRCLRLRVHPAIMHGNRINSSVAVYCYTGSGSDDDDGVVLRRKCTYPHRFPQKSVSISYESSNPVRSATPGARSRTLASH